MSFEGKIIFPKELNLKEKEVEFEKITKARVQGQRLVFLKKVWKLEMKLYFVRIKL